MPLVVSHTCVAPAPAVVPLEVLVQLQDLASSVTFESPNDDDPAVMVKTVTTHPVTSQETTSTSVSWVGCARALSQLIPSLGLWGGAEVESWVEGAASILLPYLEASSAGMISVCTSSFGIISDFLQSAELSYFSSNSDPRVLFLCVCWMVCA